MTTNELTPDEHRHVWALTEPLAAVGTAQRAVRAAQSDAGWRRMRGRIAAEQREGAADDGAASAAAETIGAITGAEARGRWHRLAVSAAFALAASVALVIGANFRSVDHSTYTAPVGQRLTVFLPDGTRADLHPGSQIRAAIRPAAGARPRLPWPRRDATRRVWLVGEASFTVTHDTARPFRVQAGNVIAEDLGTIFVVRAYPDEDRVRVVVSEGEVAVSPITGAEATTTARLVPGQVAEVNSTGAITVASPGDVSVWFGWTRDRLVFRQESLAFVAEGITRWFGRPIAMSDSALAKRRVTLDQPLTTHEAAVTALAAALDVELMQRGDTTWILSR